MLAVGILFRFAMRATTMNKCGSEYCGTVATFVAQADICRFLKVQTATYIRKLLIDMTFLLHTSVEVAAADLMAGAKALDTESRVG
jgi:hypothetical protein